MTRRVTALALGIAIATAAGSTATASAAPFEPLTEKRARAFAVKLARSVARERQVVTWHLSDAVKVRRTRIVFLYDDRNRDNVFCVAKIVVEQTARTRSVTLGGGRCNVVPDEALAIEKATLAMIRAVRAQEADIEASVRAFERDVGRCEGLVVPRGRQEQTSDLLEAGDLLAGRLPVIAQLDGFVTALQNVQPEDPELVSGVVAWRRFLTVLSALPPAARRPCAATLQWAGNSYAPEAAPADFDALADQLEALGRQLRGIARTQGRLAELGVLPSAVFGFSPVGP